MAASMLKLPLSAVDPQSFAKLPGADLRKFLLQTLDAHIEKKWTRAMLERIGV